MNHQEYDYQCAVFQWAQYQLKKYPELEYMFAVINETRGISPAKGGRDKKQGKKSGVPDICLPTPKGTYHGLYIEMKSKKGKATENQSKYITFLESQGYKTAIHNSPEGATAEIKQYMELGPFNYFKHPETEKNGLKTQCFTIRG